MIIWNFIIIFFILPSLNLKLWLCSWVTLSFHIQFFHITILFKFKSNSFFSWHFNSQELAKIKTIIKKTRYLCLMALNSYLNVFTNLFSFSISTCSRFQLSSSLALVKRVCKTRFLIASRVS